MFIDQPGKSKSKGSPHDKRRRYLCCFTMFNRKGVLSSSYRSFANIDMFGNTGFQAPLCLFIAYFGNPESPILSVTKKKSNRIVVYYCVVTM